MQNSEQRICQNCQASFVIDASDFLFYQKISVPPPTWCPECRMIRRMQWRNERVLYKRMCEAPGHSEEIISIYYKDSSVRVYDQQYWWSDAWDPMSSVKDYDFKKPFLAQFGELLRHVPQNNLMAENNINSDYVNFMVNSKNCYLISGGFSNESVLYANHGDYSKDSADLYYFSKLELSYDNVICQNSYKLFFSQNCENCSDSYFLYDCKNCKNCFGCVSLRNKQYHIFNKPYLKEEYKKRLEEFNLGSFDGLMKQKISFEKLKLSYPKKFSNLNRSTNSSGDNIFNCNGCKNSFDVLLGNNENSKFVFWAGADMKDVYDGTGVGVKGELLYEGVCVALSDARIFFSVTVRNSYDIQYSFNCHSSSDIFGCIGLKKKQYCILNKQYTKEEYEELVPRIIEHMNTMPYTDAKGRVYKYGEFFPPELSPFAYNETIAQEYFPLTKEQALESGYRWKEPEEKQHTPTISWRDLPDNIKDVSDEIVNEAILCRAWDEDAEKAQEHNCTKVFRIIPQELAFYRKMRIPLPRFCPNSRHFHRIQQRNPLKLWHRQCTCAGSRSANGVYQNTTSHFHGDSHCPNEFETSYAPDRPEIVYCEECYQGEVV